MSKMTAVIHFFLDAPKVGGAARIAGANVYEQ